MRYMKVKFFITSVLILIVGIVVTSLPRASAQRENRLSAEDQKLLEVAAKRHGGDASRLQLLKSTTVELPLTGRHIEMAKVLNTNDGQTFSVSVDQQGQEVEFSTLKSDEQRAYRARLFDRSAQSRPRPLRDWSKPIPGVSELGQQL